MSSLRILAAGSGEVAALAKLVAGFRDHLDAKGRTDAEIRRHLPRALAEGLSPSGSGLVRRYEADDEGSVATVWHRSGRAAYVYLPTWQAFEAHEARRVFREVILPSCDVWVAAVGAGVVGFLAMKGSYVNRLYVDPSEQRRGFGTRLVEHAKRCQPLGLWLHTHQENRVARAFYERHGFTIVRFGVSPPPECAPDVEYRWRSSEERSR